MYIFIYIITNYKNTQIFKVVKNIIYLKYSLIALKQGVNE